MVTPQTPSPSPSSSPKHPSIRVLRPTEVHLWRHGLLRLVYIAQVGPEEIVQLLVPTSHMRLAIRTLHVSDSRGPVPHVHVHSHPAAHASRSALRDTLRAAVGHSVVMPDGISGTLAGASVPARSGPTTVFVTSGAGDGLGHGPGHDHGDRTSVHRLAASGLQAVFPDLCALHVPASPSPTDGASELGTPVSRMLTATPAYTAFHIVTRAQGHGTLQVDFHILGHHRPAWHLRHRVHASPAVLRGGSDPDASLATTAFIPNPLPGLPLDGVQLFLRAGRYRHHFPAGLDYAGGSTAQAMCNAKYDADPLYSGARRWDAADPPRWRERSSSVPHRRRPFDNVRGDRASDGSNSSLSLSVALTTRRHAPHELDDTEPDDSSSTSGSTSSTRRHKREQRRMLPRWVLHGLPPRRSGGPGGSSESDSVPSAESHGTAVENAWFAQRALVEPCGIVYLPADGVASVALRVRTVHVSIAHFVDDEDDEPRPNIVLRNDEATPLESGALYVRMGENCDDTFLSSVDLVNPADEFYSDLGTGSTVSLRRAARMRGRSMHVMRASLSSIHLCVETLRNVVYELENVRGFAQTVVVSMASSHAERAAVVTALLHRPGTTDAEIVKPIQPINLGFYRFRIRLPAHGSATLEVKQRLFDDRTIHLPRDGSVAVARLLRRASHPRRDDLIEGIRTLARLRRRARFARHRAQLHRRRAIALRNWMRLYMARRPPFASEWEAVSGNALADAAETLGILASVKTCGRIDAAVAKLYEDMDDELKKETVLRRRVVVVAEAVIQIVKQPADAPAVVDDWREGVDDAEDSGSLSGNLPQTASDTGSDIGWQSGEDVAEHKSDSEWSSDGFGRSGHSDDDSAGVNDSESVYIEDDGQGSAADDDGSSHGGDSSDV